MSTFEPPSRPAAPAEQPVWRDPAPGPNAPPAGTLADRAAAPADAPALPGAGLSALVEQARAAQARLGDQPLPIANRDMLLVTKLLGG